MKPYSQIKKVTIIGAGGGAGYYIAKFFLLLNKNVQCFDINESAYLANLRELGAEVITANPENYVFNDSDVIIYTLALGGQITDQIHKNNPQKYINSTGEYYQKIIDDYEKGIFEQTEVLLKAFRESEIAPLFDLDFSGVTLIGVTGSKGKTSTSYMLYEVLNKLGVDVSCCTTIGANIKGREIETGLHTSTPSSQELKTIFTQMLESNSKVVVLEVSSHAIATGRVAGLKFDISVITNLQPEHLDFHKTIDHVIETKRKLVSEFLKPGGIAILNSDDVNISTHVIPNLESSDKKIFTFGRKSGINNIPHIQISNIDNKAGSVSFNIDSNELDIHNKFYLPMSGEFNIMNVLPAVIIARLQKIEINNIIKSVGKIGVISGRNEIIQENPFKVVLDFAHTPESLEAILKTYSDKLPFSNKLIVVFGAAGQRDSLKRPRMGEVAAKYADITILTAEDPRTEKLEDINEQIHEGWRKYVHENNLFSKREIYIYNDQESGPECRITAIKKAIASANDGDIIVCAGKGHEKSMTFGTIDFDWDERKIIIEALHIK